MSVTRDPVETSGNMDARVSDRESFERLVRDYQSAVCAIAYSVTRDRARSEELAQDAFFIAWRYRERVPVLTAGWVCGIARNLARNAARRRKEVAMEREPIAEARDARDQLIDHEIQQRAIAALAELPDPYREAVVLYYRGDQSMSAVAEALGVSEGTAKQRVHRGRAKLRDALAPVVTTLGATRPGAAFTAACVAAWLAGGASSAQAAPADVLPATGAPWLIPAIAGAVGSVAILVGMGVAYTGNAGSSDARVDQPTARSTARSSSLVELRARFPSGHASTRPRGFTAVTPDPDLATSKTVDFDFQQAPIHDLVMMLSFELDAPIWVDPSIEGTVDISGKRIPIMDALDEVVGEVSAIRTEVAALRLVTFGGRTDATRFGGDPLSLQLRDAPLHDVLSMIEVHLHMPIGRLAFPAPPPCLAPDGKSGIISVEGRDVTVKCQIGAEPDPSPRVTIDVRDKPAGAVLEQVLIDTHLGYELTTGFAITPDE